MSTSPPGKLLFFDGTCGLCNRLLRWLWKREKEAQLRFVSLQSPQAAGWLAGFALPAEETVLLLDEGVLYTHSDAPLRALRYLRFPWPLLQVLRLVPRSIRDGIYRWIARRRYGWFGRSDQCTIPDPGFRERLIS